MDITIDPELGGANVHMESLTFLFLRTDLEDGERTAPPRETGDDGLFMFVLYAVTAAVALIAVAAYLLRRR